MKKNIVCWILLFSFVFSACSIAYSEEERVYLAIGDSITTGYGLAKDEAGFPTILAQNNGSTLINRAVNGNTAIGIIEEFDDPSFMAAVGRADLITITCGGNDLMNVLYEEIAKAYNRIEPGKNDIKGYDIISILSNPTEARHSAVLAAAVAVLNGSKELHIKPFTEGNEIKLALVGYVVNLNIIMTVIRTVNPDADVIITTQYNPYESFTGAYAEMNTAMDAGAGALSAVIQNNSSIGGYIVADVYSAFKENPDNLMNASENPLNLDFHPNAAGHKAIAECIQMVLDELEQKTERR